MPEAGFGIIDKIDAKKDYSRYEPGLYGCIRISDDVYINDWQPALSVMKTYFHSLNRPATGLARWGVTLIPPISLPAFQDIVLADPRQKPYDSLRRKGNTLRQPTYGSPRRQLMPAAQSPDNAFPGRTVFPGPPLPASHIQSLPWKAPSGRRSPPGMSHSSWWMWWSGSHGLLWHPLHWDGCDG